MLSRLKRKHYKFTDRKTSKRGVASVIMLVFAVLSFSLGIVRSFQAHGNGDYLVGVAGLLAFLFAFAGTILGMSSLKDEDVFHGFSWMGSIGNTIIWMLILIMIMIGI